MKRTLFDDFFGKHLNMERFKSRFKMLHLLASFIVVATGFPRFKQVRRRALQGAKSNPGKHYDNLASVYELQFGTDYKTLYGKPLHQIIQAYGNGTNKRPYPCNGGLENASYAKKTTGACIVRVLDAAAGVGPQTLGLLSMNSELRGMKARRGIQYELTATDASAQSLQKARERLHKDYPRSYGKHVEFSTSLWADLPTNPVVAARAPFDVAFAIPNSFAHMLGVVSMLETLRSIRSMLRSDGRGMLIIHSRPYDDIVYADEDLFKGDKRKKLGTSKTPLFWEQHWRWLRVDDRTGERKGYLPRRLGPWEPRTALAYDVEFVLTTQSKNGTLKEHRSTSTFRAWTRSEMERLLNRAGFGPVLHMKRDGAPYWIAFRSKAGSARAGFCCDDQ